MHVYVRFARNIQSIHLYIKPTDRHRDQYLHYLSSHPYHTKKSIIYSQFLRLSRIPFKNFLKNMR